MLIGLIGLLTLLVLLFIAWMISGYLPTRNIEEPKYRLLEKTADYEIRQYESYVVAETPQKGSHKDALYAGFNELFQYISGGNSGSSRLKMTAPVIQSQGNDGQKIPMTAPVIKQGDGGSAVIAFVMPPGMSIEDLPVPRSPNVRLRTVEAQKVAVMKFSGYATEGVIRAKTEKLLSMLKRDGRTVKSPAWSAFYNPPWTPPFMMRNEVLAEIE